MTVYAYILRYKKKVNLNSDNVIHFLVMSQTLIVYCVHALLRRSLNLTKRNVIGPSFGRFPAVVSNSWLTLDKPEIVLGKRQLDSAGKDGK